MPGEGQARAGLGALLWASADSKVLVRLGLAIGCAAIGSVLAVAGPALLKVLIDGEAPSDAPWAWLWLIGLYVAALGGQRFAEQAQAYAFGTGEQLLQQRLSGQIFAHVLSLPMGFHLDRQTGGLMQTLTLGLQGVRIILTHTAFSILPVLVQAVLIGCVVGALFDGWLWASTAAAMAVYASVFAIGVKRLSRPTRAVSEAQLEASAVFADGLINVEPVKAFSAEEQMSARYQDLLAATELRWRTFHARRLENGIATALVFMASLGAVMVQAGFGFAQGRLSTGDFVLINAYILQIIRPLEMAGFALRDIAQGAHYLEKWRDLLRIAPEAWPLDDLPARRARARPLAQMQRSTQKTGPPSIRFEHVSFAYPGAGPALRDVSFTLQAGKTLAIVGPSGAGKSSLVRLIMRYYEPDAGRILIDDVPLKEIALEELRAMIGLVSQETVLFHASLEHNIRFARPDANKAALAHALQKAQLEELVARLPEGLGSPLGERGMKLSGGEKQRVAIARAVLKDAPILVLDEATSALDAVTEAALMAALKTAMVGRSCLMVTHRLLLARAADQILVLEAGQAREHGAHQDLIDKGGVYARLWAAHAQSLRKGASDRGGGNYPVDIPRHNP